ncbi:zinc ribbon domain-containing protein [Candidatus Ozemobacteraceae bacterium]|nr:zinc ribbon domain-containing protein [Candidatus Ozemobacteraceae bacterium]
MILDRLPEKICSLLSISNADEVRLAYESTSAFDGATGASWLVIHRSQVHIVSTFPLGDPQLVKTFMAQDVSSLKGSKSILGDIRLEFSLRSESQSFAFVIPSLLLHEWEILSDILQSIFQNAFHPDIEDASLGSEAFAAPAPIGTALEDSTILFQPISGVKVDVSTMQSVLDTTMDGLADQISVEVTDESSFKITDVRSDAMPDLPEKPVMHERPAASSAAKKKKFKVAQTNLISKTEPAPTDESNFIRCPKCQKKNKPDYIYCLGCGNELDSSRKAASRKVGKPPDYGYSSSESSQTEDASGCIVQLFYFIVGVGALLFFISIGK